MKREEVTDHTINNPNFWKIENYREIASALGYMPDVGFITALKFILDEYELPPPELHLAAGIFLYFNPHGYQIYSLRNDDPISTVDGDALHERIKEKIKKGRRKIDERSVLQ